VASGNQVATYDPTTSTTTSLKFKYTVQSTDLDHTTNGVTVASAIVPQSGYSTTWLIDSTSGSHEIIPSAELIYASINPTHVQFN